MVQVHVKINNTLDFIEKDEIKIFQNEIDLHRKNIYEKTGEGNDFLGWVDLPSGINEFTIREIEEDEQKIRSNSKVVVVIGIGGSYLGARAIIDALSSNFANCSFHDNSLPLVVYAGQNIGEDYLHQLMNFLDSKDYSIIVISKS
ncbi:MAG: glucose-6-phosphate isomerase, partial [Bacteroidota bacterium]